MIRVCTCTCVCSCICRCISKTLLGKWHGQNKAVQDEEVMGTGILSGYTGKTSDDTCLNEVTEWAAMLSMGRFTKKVFVICLRNTWSCVYMLMRTILERPNKEKKLVVQGGDRQGSAWGHESSGFRESKGGVPAGRWQRWEEAEGLQLPLSLREVRSSAEWAGTRGSEGHGQWTF